MAHNPDRVPLLREPILVNAKDAGDPRASEDAELLMERPGVQRRLPHVTPIPTAVTA